MFCPSKWQHNITLLIVMTTSFYQCACSRCSCHLNIVVCSPPFMSKRAPKSTRMIKGLRTAGCWLGSDPGLAQWIGCGKLLYMTWKGLQMRVYREEWGHAHVSLLIFQTDQPETRNWIRPPVCPCLRECGLCLHGIHGSKRSQASTAKSNSMVWIRIGCSLSLPM